MQVAGEKRPAQGSSRTVSPFQRLQGEIDRLFDEFGALDWRNPFSGSAFDLKWPGTGEFPVAAPMDLVEKGDKYEITVEMPGMDEKNVEVKLSNGMLTITGQKSEEKEEKDKEYHLSERRFGSVRRSFALPKGVDEEKIDASFAKGVLKVELPKKPEVVKEAKRIAVKSS